MYIYMGKGLAAKVQLENHLVSGLAYGIAQTAVVFEVSTDILSITTCPKHHYVRTIRVYLS